MEGNAVELKTYQAYSMAEALAAVKRDLGGDAVILNTRSYRRGGVLGLGRRTVIELTATAGGHVAGARGGGAARRPARGGRPPLAAMRAYAGSAAFASDPARDEPPTDLDRLRTKRLAQAMHEEHLRRQREAAEARATAAPPVGPAASIPILPLAGPSPLAPIAPNREAPPTLPPPGQPEREVARRFILTAATPPTGAPPTGAPPTRAAPTRAAPEPAAATQAAPIEVATPQSAPTPSTSRPAGREERVPPRQRPGETMQDELAAIRHMVGEVLRRQPAGGDAAPPTMPQALFDMYLKLVGQDVSDELADRIVNAVRDELSADDLDDGPALREAVLRRLAAYVPVADEPLPAASDDGRPLTIALVGPTGVGKTTTVAKLAACFKLRHGRRVGLVTADTYRIAAVDQLRTYANIIGLPLRVVLTPAEMGQAVRAMHDCDVILIDTAGRSQNDPSRIEELRAFIVAAEPHEVHLVLSGTAGERVLLSEAEAFSVVGIDKVVITKLDEAVSFGMLIDVVRSIGKSLSFFTTGQEVPDHIEVVRPERLARLILGEPLDARHEDGLLHDLLAGSPA